MSALATQVANLLRGPQETLFDLLRGITAEQRLTNALLQELVTLEVTKDERAAQKELDRLVAGHEFAVRLAAHRKRQEEEDGGVE